MPDAIKTTDAAIEPKAPDTAADVQSRNLHIHGARGLFAFAVFVFHVFNSGLPPHFIAEQPFRFFAQSLAYGVELFFGISGIVIVAVFQKTTSYGVFILNRITRIMPVLWVTVLVALAMTLVATDRLSDKTPLELTAIIAGNLLALPNMVYMPMIHPAAWSLSFEFTFYIVVMLFGILGQRFGQTRTGKWITWGIIGLLSAGLLLNHMRGIYFVSGTLVALGVFSSARWQAIVRHPGLWMIVFLIAWRLSAEQFNGNIDMASYLQISISKPLVLVTLAIGAVAGTFTLAGIYYGQGIFKTFLLWPVMQWLGTISYSFYLWQTITMQITKQVMIRTHLMDISGPFTQLVLFVLSLPVTLVVSHLSQIYLETHAMRLLRKVLMPR